MRNKPLHQKLTHSFSQKTKDKTIGYFPTQKAKSKKWFLICDTLVSIFKFWFTSNTIKFESNCQNPSVLRDLFLILAPNSEIEIRKAESIVSFKEKYKDHLAFVQSA